MKILTWNVNVLRTCLDYHPFASMKKKNVEGLLDELDAQILCFQEHKTVRAKLEKSMACPGPYDAFWTFPRSKTGYSGVCTYVDSRCCVPLKAEEGITGLLLEDRASTMRPPWTVEERIGFYPSPSDIAWIDEVDGQPFNPEKLDKEGRAVVCDFGLFVLFNLYCPNETNDARRPYKMNFLYALQERVRLLQAAGREVIVVGDINIVRAPIDSGEGPVRSSAAQHYEHPARRTLDDWCFPKGPMIDVVRECWPKRDDMFTCWNQKLDARSANYGSRIDMILCTTGLRPWIKDGNIMPKVFGSDHCPVYIKLHESIVTPKGETLYLRDMLNPKDRPSSTAPIYPNAVAREVPEPPRFATKFLDEFSARQTTLKSFFGGGKKCKPKSDEESVMASFNTTQTPPNSLVAKQSKTISPSLETHDAENAKLPLKLTKSDEKITDPTTDREEDKCRPPLTPKPMTKRSRSASDSKTARQAKISNFLSQPKTNDKRKSPSTLSSPSSASSKKRVASTSPLDQAIAAKMSPETQVQDNHSLTEEEASMVSQAIIDADAEEKARKAKDLPQWSNIFAKKLPPLCTAHQKPCKDFIVMKPGPNKGKRFWLCSLPVGAGYDKGRSKRLREEVNHKFRCDFFMWDSANTSKEKPAVKESHMQEESIH
ncbi:exodeoxyribonuclease III [Cryptococcus depauperatus CBS 7841]|uniref:DNA-(apurinic or apyrimidinic site) endonuclease n=1 Tax=Cryptococcus depauperatus CBS 7841 TaxID=1295531 RepID=A0AAJ8JQB4_9TREE